MTQACDSSKTTVLPPSYDSDDPPDMSIFPSDGSNQKPPPDSKGGDWVASPCNPKARYRITDSGHIDVEGYGTPKFEWPDEVNEWRLLIEKTADANGVSRALMAGIVAAESGGAPNMVSQDGRLGLAGIPRILARQVANKDFPKDRTEIDVPDSLILQPAWNLIHASKAMAHFLKVNGYNLVAAIASYDHASVKCETNTSCPMKDEWGILTDCGYVDQVIACTNAAVDAGYLGPRHVDLGPPAQTQPDPNEPDLMPYITWAAIGAIGFGVAVAVHKSMKKGR